MARLALHVCCAPCMLLPAESLIAEFGEVVLVYYNPNIHPREEYELRRTYVTEQAERLGLQAIELPYTPEIWEDDVAHLTRPDRCTACYALRLGEVAAWASHEGFDAFTTTLSISPYQDPIKISEEGKAAAEAHDIEYLDRTFADFYPASVQYSRELGIYRQNYCGCRLSKIEAEEERAARKAARRAAKETATSTPNAPITPENDTQ